MMLAHRVQRYVPQEDHLAVVLLKPHPQVPDGLLPQPDEQGLVGPRDPAGRALQSLPVRVLYRGDQYFPNGPLDAGQVHPALRRIPLLRGFGGYGSRLQTSLPVASLRLRYASRGAYLMTHSVSNDGTAQGRPGRAVRGRIPTAPSVVFTRSRCVRARR